MKWFASFYERVQNVNALIMNRVDLISESSQFDIVYEFNWWRLGDGKSWNCVLAWKPLIAFYNIKSEIWDQRSEWHCNDMFCGEQTHILSSLNSDSFEYRITLSKSILCEVHFVPLLYA